MTPQTDIKNFEGQQIRTAWDADEGKLYFSVVDIVQVLTDSANATDYFKKLRKREPELAAFVGTNCPHVEMVSDSGKRRKTLAGDADVILHIILSIPSQKVEKLKSWLESFQQNSDIDTGEIIMYQPDETIKLSVRLDNETVWLTQQQMAELFETTRNNITLHIDNIFKEHELESNSVSKESLLTAADGKKYQTKFYNLDVIISVGYRVKSVRGTKFRQWANKVLKDYLLKGYAADSRYYALEQRVSEQGKQISELQNKVDFFVRTSLPPVEGVFFQGQIFDAYAKFQSFIMQAQKEIVLIDNYVDVTVLERLSVRNSGVSTTIYTSKKAKLTAQDIQNFNAQYPPLTVIYTEKMHDRFLIIDNQTLYHIGASLKDLGKKCFAFNLLDSSFIPDILAKV